MKAVTEFASFTLAAANKAKAALVAEGKAAEEIQAAIGTTFKMEGEKLGFFMAALDVAAANAENLKRVMVLRLGEGEAAPAKAVQAEDICYVPEMLVQIRKEQPKQERGRGGKGRGDKGRGEKSSPWGMSPEEKAAKQAKSLANQAAQAAKGAKPN